MNSSTKKKIGMTAGALAVVAIITFIFMTPYNRTPGVRLGGTATIAPADWTNISPVREMQLKPAGFPPFVANIWYVGTPEGVITATRPDNGYWGRRVRANPNATIRLGNAAYSVTAREVTQTAERNRMLQAYVNKYNPDGGPGLSYEALSNPDMPWEVFFWTPR